MLETPKAATAASCVTTIYTVGTLSALMVIFATRVLVLGLVAALIVMLALPEPLVVLRLSHSWSLCADQAILDFISNIWVLFSSADTDRVVLETPKAATAASCVTTIYTVGTLSALMVIFATRVLVLGLAAALIVMLALPEPLVVLNYFRWQIQIG